MRKKKSNLELEPKEKKSRAKYKCPDDLKEILKIVNSVPPGVTLPVARDVISKLEKTYLVKHSVNRRSDLDDATYVDMWFEIVDECFKDFFDKNIKKDIFQFWFDRLREDLSKLKKAEMALLYSVIDTYEYYRKTRKDVKAVINYVFELNKNSPILHLYDTDLHTPLLFTQKNGETRATPQGFSKVIERIDLERLRACEICSRIFWANYKNSFTCSTPCLNALRQRRHREKNKEAINEKRRANYDRNKKLKQLKEKKNGTL